LCVIFIDAFIPFFLLKESRYEEVESVNFSNVGNEIDFTSNQKNSLNTLSDEDFSE
jgi:hypothetical protein